MARKPAPRPPTAIPIKPKCQELDEELTDVFTASFPGHFRAAQILEPRELLGRSGASVGKRKLSPTFGVGQKDADAVL